MQYITATFVVGLLEVGGHQAWRARRLSRNPVAFIMEQTSPPLTKADTAPVVQDEAAPEALTPTQRKRQEYFAKARERSGYEFNWLLERKGKAQLVFDTVDGPVRAKLRYFGIFHFQIQLRGKSERVRMEKIKVFTVSDAKDQERLKEHIKIHQATRAKGLVPQPRAAYNLPIPEGLVGKAIEEGQQLAVMLLNGVIVVGVPILESLYSILLKVPDSDGAELFVFKHGLVGARLYDEIKPE